MTIFAERNKKGQPTGVWLIEIRKVTDGVAKTIRRRARNYAEAKKIEVELRGSMESTPRPRLPAIVEPNAIQPYSPGTSYENFSLVDMTPPPRIFTLADLYAEGRSIYLGAKDEQQSCERLFAALSIIGFDMDVRELRTAALDHLVKTLQDRDLNPKTINRYLYAVSGALRWALSRELIVGMPTIPRQNEGVGRINFLTERDQGRVLQWLSANEFKDVAFVTEALLTTGFRISEFLRLKPEDVQNGWVILHAGETKNDEGRRVYIDELAEPLKAQIEAGLPSYTRLRVGLSAASTALGIEPKVTPHVLRHSCATTLTTKNVSLAIVGKILGHKSLVTTLKYAHGEDDALIAAAKLLKISK
jgi:site-specific recombinase XerD